MKIFAAFLLSVLAILSAVQAEAQVTVREVKPYIYELKSDGGCNFESIAKGLLWVAEAQSTTTSEVHYKLGLGLPKAPLEILTENPCPLARAEKRSVKQRLGTKYESTHSYYYFELANVLIDLDIAYSETSNTHRRFFTEGVFELVLPLGVDDAEFERIYQSANSISFEGTVNAVVVKLRSGKDFVLLPWDEDYRAVKINSLDIIEKIVFYVAAHEVNGKKFEFLPIKDDP